VPQGGVSFVGRGAELEGLGREFSVAAKGRSRVVVVEGDAGIGKTTLVRHWLERVLPESGDGNAIALLGVGSEESEATLTWGLLGQVNHELARLGGEAPGRPPAPDADPLSVGVGVLTRLEALAERSVVVAVLEDLHWSDDASAEALRFALRRLGSVRLLTIATVRPPFPGRLGEGWRRLVGGSGRLMHLDGLDEIALVAMASAFGRQLGARRASQLRAHTDGNPLWVSALLRELPDEVLDSDAVELAVPRDLAGTIRAQHGALGHDARSLVAAGSVLGTRFDLALAAGIAQVDDVAGALEEAQAAGMLVDLDGRMAAFGHALVRAAILSGLGPVHRAALHLAVATRLDGVVALDHLAAATLAPSETVAAELERAARLELAANEVNVAARHAEAAWRVSPPGDAHRRRALLAMEATLAAGLPKWARAHVDEVSDDGPDPERDLLLGWLARSEGRFVMADHLLCQAEAALDAASHVELATWRQRRAAVALERALLAVVRMAGSDAAALARQALDLGIEGPSRHLANAVESVALALEGQTAAALALLDPGAPAIVDLHELGVRGLVRLWSDDMAGAYEDLSMVVARMEAGEALVVMQARAYLAETCFRMGRLEEARSLAETACEMVDEAERWWDMVIVHTRAGCAAAVMGDPAAARSHIAAITQLATRIGAAGRTQDAPPAASAAFQRLRSSVAASSGVAVALAIAEDDPATLLAAAEPAAELVQNTDPGTFPFGPVLAEALVGLARLAEAERCLDAYQARAERIGRRQATMQALKVRGMLHSARAEHDKARRCFDEALRIGAELEAPLEVARVRLAFGRALAAALDTGGARRELNGALRLLTAAGAAGWLGAVERSLAGLAQLGNEGRSGRLTPSEARIAKLAAEGLSNPEIAEALSLSRKTVEYHLSHVFAKLGVQSRSALGDFFAD